MHLFKTILIVAATLSSSVLASAVPTSVVGINNLKRSPSVLAEKRGDIQDIVSILRRNKKVGTDFCSTYLHLPPYAATRTVTKTKTAVQSRPLSTTTLITVLTKTGTALTVVRTNVVVVGVTPTSKLTLPTAVPFTSTVTTITSVNAITTTVATQTVTSYTPRARSPAHAHDPSLTRLPYWLNQYSYPQVSKACPKVITPKTKTVTKSVTTTRTIKTGVATIGTTSTAVVTPTRTSIRTVTSLSTASAAITTIYTPSSSLVPVSATEFQTTLVTVTATAVVTLPSPVGRIKIISAADGSEFGYVGLINMQGSNKIVSASSDAITVTLSPSQSGLMNILAPPSSPYPYLGAVYQRDAYSLVQNLAEDASFLEMGFVKQVAPGTQSEYDWSGSSLADKDHAGTFESQIWSLASCTGALSITWTNENGPSVNPSLFLIDWGYGHTFLQWGSETFARSSSATRTTKVQLIFEPIA